MLVNIDAGQCNTCGETFEPHDDRQLYCTRKCRTRKMNSKVCREYAKDIARKSYHRHKSKPQNIKYYLLRHAKARAAKKGIEFSIAEDDIILPEYCPILGIKLSRDSVRTGYSLDKKDP